MSENVRYLKEESTRTFLVIECSIRMKKRPTPRLHVVRQSKNSNKEIKITSVCLLSLPMDAKFS